MPFSQYLLQDPFSSTPFFFNILTDLLRYGGKEQVSLKKKKEVSIIKGALMGQACGVNEYLTRSPNTTWTSFYKPEQGTLLAMGGHHFD